MYTSEEIREARFQGKRLALKADLMDAVNSAHEYLYDNTSNRHTWKYVLDGFVENINFRDFRVGENLKNDLITVVTREKLTQEQQECLKPLFKVWAKVCKIKLQSV